MYCVTEMRMSNLQAKLASAVLIGIAASIGVIAPPGAARAADNCLTQPGVENPQGKHWYYRIERGSGRHCWYQRGEDETPARAATDQPAPAKPAPRTADAAPTRSLADARAEFQPTTRVEDNSRNAAPTPSVWPDPPAPAAVTTGTGPGAGMSPSAPDGSQVTSRWPQASGAPTQAGPAPVASLMVAEAQPDEAAATTPPPAPPQQAGAPLMREVGSLQKLVLVAFGALALAGITGSTVYRLAGARSRRRRQQRWPQKPKVVSPVAARDLDAPWVEPEMSSTVPHAEPVSQLDVDDVAAARLRSRNSDDSFEKIEDFLSRLTKQLQEEMQTTHSTELEKPGPR